MRARPWAAVAAAAIAAAPAAAQATRTLSYQGYTSQGHQILFKRTKAGIVGMNIAVRANCVNDQGQSQGDYDFTLRAIDKKADHIRRGRFTVSLPGDNKTPNVTIRGRVNKNGVARGTMTAAGPVTNPTNLGTCRSGSVRWTAGP
jgi:hypothetical protein